VLAGRGPAGDADGHDRSRDDHRLSSACTHPEGGWYRETWRAEAPPGERAGATAILFLLEAGQCSHWHRVDAAELWLWHAGHPLRLLIAPVDDGPVTATTLGADILAGHMPSRSSRRTTGRLRRQTAAGLSFRAW